ncbi:MAG: hypothetical protein Q8904_14505 [Bacteroidota bacterium]|nr:hypothetical protein [Bacteroidota bacterium]
MGIETFLLKGMEKLLSHFLSGKIPIVLCISVLVLSASACSKDNNNSGNSNNSGGNSSSTDSGGTYSQSNGTATLMSKTYSSSEIDLSAVKVTGGTLTLSNSKISSTGNTSSTDNSSFYGLNAVILVYASSGSAVINSSGNTVTSSGKGANGIFAYGSGASSTTTGDKFTMTGDGGHAIMCSGGGTITVKNDTAVTSGGSSSTIATDRGGGTITLTGGVYTANGNNSATIYSTGKITCTDATLVANGAEALVIEGSNSITLNNCAVKCTYSKWGSLIYQSMSGDANGADGYLTMTGGSFTYTGTKGGMFYNTNSTAYITLNGVTLNNSCDTLVRCIKGSWGGSSASSGGITYFVAKGQTLSGLIYVDASSKAYITLSSSSAFTGAIDKAKAAGTLTLTLDNTSIWTVTGTSYINGAISGLNISNSTVSNIVGNGNNVYYLSSANSALGGKTYNLSGGGQLIPN